MTAVAEAWKRALESRGTSQPVETPEVAERLGREWAERLAERYGLGDEDWKEIMAIDRENHERTFIPLMRMQRGGLLEPHEVVAALHASGFVNGLALGLELGRRE